MRGAKTDLQDMGEETDDLANSTSKLREDMLALTGVDIMKNNTEFKSTTQFLRELHSVWDQLSDIDQANVAEQLAGKTRSNALLSILNNWEDVEAAIKDSETASEGLGSATVENERYLESMDGKIAQLTDTWQKMWATSIDSDFLKFWIDAGNAVLKFINAIGGLPTIIAAVGAGLATWNIDTIQTKFANFATKITTFFSQFKGLNIKAAFGNIGGLFGKNNYASQINELNEALQKVNLARSQGITVLTAENSLQAYGNTVNEAENNIRKKLTATIEAEKLARSTLTTIITAGITIAMIAWSKYKQQQQEEAQLREQQINDANSAEESYEKLQAAQQKYYAVVDKNNYSENELSSAVSDVTSALGDKASVLDGLTAGTDEYNNKLDEQINREKELAKVKARQGYDAATAEATNNNGRSMSFNLDDLEFLGWSSIPRQLQEDIKKNFADSLVEIPGNNGQTGYQVKVNGKDINSQLSAYQGYLETLKDYTEQEDILERSIEQTTINLENEKERAGENSDEYKALTQTLNTFNMQLESTKSNAALLNKTFSSDWQAEMQNVVDQAVKYYSLDMDEAVSADNYDQLAETVEKRLGITADAAKEVVVDRIKEIFDITDEEIASAEKAATLPKELQDTAKRLNEINNMTRDSYEKLSESVGNYRTEVNKLSGVIANKQEVDSDEYAQIVALVGANADLTGVVEQTSDSTEDNTTYVIRDTKALQDLIDANYQSSDAWKAVTSNMGDAQNQALYLIADLYDLTSGMNGLTDANRANADAILDQLHQLDEQIDRYSILRQQIAGNMDAFDAFTQAQTNDAEFNYDDQMVKMFNALNEGLKDGKFGTETFKSAFEGIVPKDVTDGIDDAKEQLSAMVDYVQKLNKQGLITIDVKTGEIQDLDQDNVISFIQQGLENGTFEGSMEGFELATDESLQDIADRFGMTTEMIVGFMEAVSEYGFSGENFLSEIPASNAALDKLDTNINKVTRSMEDYQQAQIDAMSDGDPAGAKEAAKNFEVEREKLIELSRQAYQNIEDYAALDQQAKDLQATIDNPDSTTDIEATKEELYGIQQQMAAIGQPTEIDITLATSQIDSDIDSIHDAIDGLRQEGKKPISLIVNLSEGKLSADQVSKWTDQQMLSWLQNRSSELNSTKTTINNNYNENNADELQQTIDKASEAKKAVEDVGKTKPKPKVDTSNIEKATSKVNKLLKRLDKLGDTHTVKVVTRSVLEDGRNNDTLEENGQMHNGGHARVDGGVTPNGKVLVGEEGPETIVSRDSGTYETVGENGPEFIDAKKGDIVFNAKQTKDLFTKGRTSTRGKALVNGNATKNNSIYYGNVDVANRPIVDLGDGNYATSLTSFQEKWVGDEKTGSYIIGHFAQILKDGTILSDSEFASYMDKILSSSNPFSEDRKGYSILYKIDKLVNGKKITDANLQEAFAAADAWDVWMHNYQDSLYKDRASKEIDKTSGKSHAVNNGATSKDEHNALVGEEGAELGYNKKTGTYQLYGKNGPEVTDIPKDTVIFDADQTKDILKDNSSIDGDSFAKGTTRGHTETMINKSSSDTSAGFGNPTAAHNNINSNVDAAAAVSRAASDASKASKDVSKASKDSKETIDWFERRLQIYSEQIEYIDAAVENMVGYQNKNPLIDQQLKLYQSEMDDYAQSIAMYEQKAAEAMAKLPADIAAKAKAGHVSIQDIVESSSDNDSDKESLSQQISDYEKWADKVYEVRTAMEELQKTMREAELKKFNNIVTDYTNKLNLLSTAIDYVQSKIDLFETQGDIVGASFYNIQGQQAQKQVETYTSQLDALQKKLAETEASNPEFIGTEEWWEENNQIIELYGNIVDAKKAVEEYSKAVEEIPTTVFDGLNDSLEKQIALLQAGIKGLAGSGAKNRVLTAQGGLYTQQYDANSRILQYYQQQANAQFASIPQQYQDMIRSGGINNIDLNEVDSDVAKAINKFKEWQGKIDDTKTSMYNLQQSMRDLELDKFNNIVDQYSHEFDARGKIIDIIEKTKDLYTSGTTILDDSTLERERKQYTKQIELLTNEQAALQKQMDDSVNSGIIKKGSDEWWEMQSQIMDVNASLIDARASLKSFNEELENVHTEVFERVAEILDKERNMLEKALDTIRGGKGKNEVVDYIKAVDKESREWYNNQLSYYQNLADQALAKLPADLQAYLKTSKNVNVDELKTSNPDVADAIEDYEKWEDKIMDVNASLYELKQTLSDLELDKFNNIVKDFQDISDMRDSIEDIFESMISLSEASGRKTGVPVYEAQLEQAESELENLNKKRAAATEQLNKAIASGDVEVGSENWQEMVKTVNDIDKAVIDANTDVEKLKLTIADVSFNNFKEIESNIENIETELNNLIDLFRQDDAVAEETAEWTNNGITQLGLQAQAYETNRKQVDDYATAINELNKRYKNGDYTLSEYNERLQELISGQYASAKAAESAKDAIVDLYEARVNKEIDIINDQVKAYNELVDAENDALDAEKDLHDYRKSIEDDTKSVTDLQRQLAAIANDDSNSARAQRAKLQDQLNSAQRDLSETEYDHSMSSQQDSLSNQQNAYQKQRDAETEALQKSLNDREAIIAQAFAIVQANAAQVGEVLTQLAQQQGIIISDTLTNSWGAGELALANYGQQMDASTSAFVAQLQNVGNETIQEQMKADQASLSYVNLFNTRADNLIAQLMQTRQSTDEVDMSVIAKLYPDLVTTFSPAGGYDTTGFDLAIDDVGYSADDANDVVSNLHGTLSATLEAGYDTTNTVNSINSIKDACDRAAQAARDMAAALGQQAAAQERANAAAAASGRSGGGSGSGSSGSSSSRPKTSYYGTGESHYRYTSSQSGVVYDKNDKRTGWTKNKGGYAYKGSNGTVTHTGHYRAAGVHNLDMDEIAWTQEYGDEAILSPTRNAILTPLKSGDSVLTRAQTENLYNWANVTPAQFGVPSISGTPKSTGSSNTMTIGNLVTVNGNIDDTNIKRMEKVAQNAVTTAFRQFSQGIHK